MSSPVEKRGCFIETRREDRSTAPFRVRLREKCRPLRSLNGGVLPKGRGRGAGWPRFLPFLSILDPTRSALSPYGAGPDDVRFASELKGEGAEKRAWRTRPDALFGDVDWRGTSDPRPPQAHRPEARSVRLQVAKAKVPAAATDAAFRSVMRCSSPQVWPATVCARHPALQRGRRASPRARHRGGCGDSRGQQPEPDPGGEFGYGKPVTIGADDSLESAIKIMTDHNVRRLPVIEGERLVGVLSITDFESKVSANEQRPAKGTREGIQDERGEARRVRQEGSEARQHAVSAGR